MISLEKLESVAEIGHLACEACGDDDFSDVVLSRVERLLDAEGAIFYDMSGSYSRPVFGKSFYRKVERQYGEMYSDYFCQLDPCFNNLQPENRSPFLSTASTQKVIKDENDYMKSEYYNDFLRPQNIHSSVIFSLQSENNLLGLFGFQRAKQKPMFDEESHLLVRLIAAPLLQALDRRRNNLKNKPNNLSVSFHPESLTLRQTEVAKLITLGLSNPEISRELGISCKTVENHLTKIYAQTNAKNRVTLAQALSLMLHTRN